MPITMQHHRNRLGRFIFFSSIGLLLLVCLYYLLGGFTPNELQELLKRLIPIKAVYLTALIKYIIANPFQDANAEAAPLLNRTYFWTSTTIIGLHMIGLIILVTLSAFFNTPSFDGLLNAIVAIESIFGLYVGLFLNHLFEK